MNRISKPLLGRLIPSVGRIKTNVCSLSTAAAVRPAYDISPSSIFPVNKMPPNHKASIGKLETFILPERVVVSEEHRVLGAAMVEAWRKTSIFQIQMTENERTKFVECLKASRDFFKRPHVEKAKCVDDQNFAGYIASGEELTAGIADYSEIFTVIKDLPLSDHRVQARWPCHGPCPWPNKTYKNAMNQFMKLLGDSGEKLLQLTALGLGLTNLNTFCNMTEDGWHHMRVLRFPQLQYENGKGKKGRGIGSHTDYGLLVIAAPESTGGDFVRPRMEGESIEEWQRSAAGASEDDEDENWLFVPPAENTMTVFPGDMMQHLTNGFLPATPHKVALNTSERHALAYFHEPNFNTVIETLPQYRSGLPENGKKIHYGSHFTNQFLNNYPLRVTAERIRKEKRMDVLEDVRNRALADV